ncbi:la-related protein 6B-like isoform X1 [Typha angustifolia]|uniref:la-related protein 6B-like isoform X1 n=1 Tax=Typha angustifolia TaxID=59011 RepID=UPI003C308F9A
MAAVEEVNLAILRSKGGGGAGFGSAGQGRALGGRYPQDKQAVPISVVASFRRIRALAHNNVLLAAALRKSFKLVISDDGERVRRQKPFTESDVEELQARIIVAENLPEDHCYQNLLKVFSAVGNVKAIHTCYPQMPNGTTAAVNRSSKLDTLFANKLHALMEYETVDNAEKAVIELNNGKNWSGLRVHLLLRCTKPEPGRGRKSGQGHESNDIVNEDDIATSNQPFETGFFSIIQIIC